MTFGGGKKTGKSQENIGNYDIIGRVKGATESEPPIVYASKCPDARKGKGWARSILVCM